MFKQAVIALLAIFALFVPKMVPVGLSTLLTKKGWLIFAPKRTHAVRKMIRTIHTPPAWDRIGTSGAEPFFPLGTPFLNALYTTKRAIRLAYLTTIQKCGIPQNVNDMKDRTGCDFR